MLINILILCSYRCTNFSKLDKGVNDLTSLKHNNLFHLNKYTRNKIYIFIFIGYNEVVITYDYVVIYYTDTEEEDIMIMIST